MKGKKVIWVGFVMLVSSCVSNYDFGVTSTDQYLVVESFISDVAYSDFINQPTEARYFEVELKLTSTTSNIRDELVTGAEVKVVDDLNEEWCYVENEEGKYLLFYEDFRTELDRSYRLEIILEDGVEYVSDYESSVTESLSGELQSADLTKEVSELFLGEETIREVRGVNVTLAFDQALVAEEYNFKWDFITTYGYIARLNPSFVSPVYRCWLTENLHIDDIILSEVGDRKTFHELFFFDTGDSKIYEGVSVLVRQQTLNKDYFNYWEGVKKQEEQANLFAEPPANLGTNMHPVGHEGKVFGYFGVVKEGFYRWFFSPDMVSYEIIYPESLKNSCNIPGPPESCFDCTKAELVYEASVTNVKPTWWED